MPSMPREPESFCEQVATMMRQVCPEREIELVGTFEMRINGRHLALQNLYRMVTHDPDRGVEIVEQFLDHLIEGEAASNVPMPFEVARDRIMPRIQPNSIFEHLDPDLVVAQPFVNNTIVLYVIDMPHLTVSITLEQMMKWGVDIDEIDRVARENLDEYSPDLRVRLIEEDDGGKAAIFSEFDGYDASRLLLGGLHAKLAPILGPSFYVGAPARDAFVALTLDPPGFVDRIHSRICADYKRLPYPISTDYFIVTMDGVAGTAAVAA